MSKKLALLSKSFLVIVVAIFFGFVFSHKAFATNSSKIVAGASVQQNYQLKVDSGGNSHVLLVDQKPAPWKLNYVSCGDNKCIVNNLPDVYPNVTSGKMVIDTGTIYSPSFYLESNNLAVITYLKFNGTNYDLKFVRCSDIYCSVVTPTTIATVTCCGVDGAVSVDRGSDTFPKVLYTNSVSGTNSVNYLNCNDLNCVAETVRTIESSATLTFRFPTIVTSSSSTIYPFLSYYRLGASNGDLKIYACVDITCAAASSVSAFIGTNTTVAKTSVFLDNLNFPRIAYQFGTGTPGFFTLKYVRCTTVNCSAYTGPVVPSFNDPFYPNHASTSWASVMGNTGGILWFPTGGGKTNEVAAYGVVNTAYYSRWELRMECIDGCLSPAGSEKAASCYSYPNAYCYPSNLGGNPSIVTGVVSGGFSRFVYQVSNTVTSFMDTRVLTCNNSANGCYSTGETNISLFIDYNNNGTRDSGESLVTGLSLLIYNNTVANLLNNTVVKTCTSASGPCTPSTVFAPNSPTYAPHYFASGNAIPWQSWLVGFSIALPHPFVATGFDQSNSVTLFAGNINPFTFQTSSVVLDGASVELGIKTGSAITVSAWYDHNEDGVMNSGEWGFGMGYPGFDNTTTAKVEANIGGTDLQPLNLWVFGSTWVGVKNVAAFAGSNFKVTPYTGTCVASGTNCWRVTKYYWTYTPASSRPLSYLGTFTNFNDPGTTTTIDTAACGAGCGIYLGLDKIDFDVKASQITGSANPSPSPVTLGRIDQANSTITVDYTNGWAADASVALAITGCSVISAPSGTVCDQNTFSPTWSQNPVPYCSSMTNLYSCPIPVSLTLNTNGTMPNGEYLLSYKGTVSTAAPNYPNGLIRTGTLKVNIISQPWVKVTGGDVGSKQAPIKLNYVSPGTAGQIVGIKIINQGSGYTSVPSLTISPPDCTPNPSAACATATATAIKDSSGKIRDIKMTNKGAGYTSIPTLSGLNSAGCTTNCATAVVLLAGNGDYLAIAGKIGSTLQNFSSAKSWLISTYSDPKGVDDQTGLTSATPDYYSYFWNNFGVGKATDWTPPGGCSTFPNGFYYNPIAPASCVLIARYDNTKTPPNVPDFPDNGVFRYDGDITYNIDYPYSGTNGGPDSCTKPCAGDSFPLKSPSWTPTNTGNPTVFFINGNLRVNKDIIVQGNKKIVFVVKGDVEIDPYVAEVDAYIITSGSFNSAKWLNSRNQTRFSNLQAIEQKIIEYYNAVGYYPNTWSDSHDTSDGCSTESNVTDWWYHGTATGGLGPVGGRDWNGSTVAGPSIKTPCNATTGLKYELNRSNIPGYTPFDIDNYVDPTNGLDFWTLGLGKKTCTSISPLTPADCAMYQPKKFAYRYGAIEIGTPAGQPKAYMLFATMEDDGNIDMTHDFPDPREYYLCGGQYNDDRSWINSGGGNFPTYSLRSFGKGEYCHVQNLVIKGGLVAGNTITLARNVRDDNNSNYDHIPTTGGVSVCGPSGNSLCGNPHQPTPAEQFNFDPAFFYYFAKEGSNQQSLFGVEKPLVINSRP